MDPINARCVDCGAIFPRSTAAERGDDRLACPCCGHEVVRGIPEQHTALGKRTNARCRACGATFPHGEAKTPTQGVLACPACGSNSEVTPMERPKEA